MIVIGADPHKYELTVAAINQATGELLGHLTVSTKAAGLKQLLDWANDFEGERIFALEDCRHLTAHLERFLVDRGERVIRVAPKLMARARASHRERGKSDPIDATSVARAALQEGPDTLPGAFLDDQAMQIKLLLDHREDLEQESTKIQNRLRWHMFDLWPELEIGNLDSMRRLEWLAGRLRRAGQSTRVKVCRELVTDLKRSVRRSRELEREITQLVRAKNPELLELVGCGGLTAAKLIAETAGVERFPSASHLARLSGVAPVPASSGTKDRHRLDRKGNRQLNLAFHRIAITQGRLHPPAKEYLARKQAEGKSRKEAIRCLKRQLVRPVLRALRPPTPDEENLSISIKMSNFSNRQALVGLT